MGIELLRAAGFTGASEYRAAAAPSNAPIVVDPSVALTPEVVEELSAIVQAGRTVVLFEREPGDDLSWLGATPPAIAHGNVNDLAVPTSPSSPSDSRRRTWPTGGARTAVWSRTP